MFYCPFHCTINCPNSFVPLMLRIFHHCQSPLILQVFVITLYPSSPCVILLQLIDWFPCISRCLTQFDSPSFDLSSHTLIASATRYALNTLFAVVIIQTSPNIRNCHQQAAPAILVC